MFGTRTKKFGTRKRGQEEVEGVMSLLRGVVMRCCDVNRCHVTEPFRSVLHIPENHTKVT
uniref:Uncharacterized protein n=1 Tax=Timema cristinae TaxID=61476 RepID=A0A7R9H7Y5_TIMCR|nr:unnamed protein product [Timema cristinae]